MMTLDGTNTWVLREPGASRSVVVDPGPIEDGHLDELDEQTGDVAPGAAHPPPLRPLRGGRRASPRARAAPVRALDPAYCFDADPLVDGEVVDVDGLQLRVVTTPGHTADSISLVLPGRARAADRRHGARPRHDGRRLPGRPARPLLRLDRADARRWPPRGEVDTIWPAHGPVLDDALGVLDYYLVHRRQRLAQVEDALAAARASPVPDRRRRGSCPRQVVEIVYQDVDESLWGAAEWSVRAQLAYLAGTVELRGLVPAGLGRCTVSWSRRS